MTPYHVGGTFIVQTPLGPYQTVLTIEVSLVQRLVASMHTQATPLNKRRPKGDLIESDISIFGVLVWQTNHLHDDPCGIAALALAMTLGGVTLTVSLIMLYEVKNLHISIADHLGLSTGGVLNSEGCNRVIPL